IDPRLPLTFPPFPEPKVVARQWVRYVSPEGYPYLYDEVTGDSEWVVSDEGEGIIEENEQQASVAQAPTGVTNGGAAQGEPGNRGADLSAGEKEAGPDGTASTKMGGQGLKTFTSAENDSVGTCEVSQWSQDTSDPDARNSAGETAMHLAATQHSLRGLSLLLACGASINAIDGRGRTPLHAVCASVCDNGGSGSDSALGCIELLLSSGALEDARDAMGQTALHLSALAGNLGAAQALLAAGATMMTDDAGNSPLHVAAAQGHSDIIQLFVLGSQDESARKVQASSDAEGRPNGRAPADIGRLRSAYDGGSCPDPVGDREKETSPADGVAFGDGDLRLHHRSITHQVREFGAKEKYQEVARGKGDGRFRSKDSNSACYDATSGAARSVGNVYIWGEPAPPKSTLCDIVDDPCRERVHRETMESGWQSRTDTHNRLSVSSTRDSSRASEDDSNNHSR
ncbi:unnamed protein product, partial [Ectocarpus sp. 12 AP-2014]